MYDLPIKVRGENATCPSTSSPNRWAQPTDVFSVLLILGGDIVNKALAQLAGGVITPVTFSFGKCWYKRIEFSRFEIETECRMGVICPFSLTRKCQ
jgi:hypothetical protein